MWSPRGLLGGCFRVGHKVKLCNYPTTLTTDLILTHFLAVTLFLFIDPAISFILVICDFTSDVDCRCVEGLHIGKKEENEFKTRYINH